MWRIPECPTLLSNSATASRRSRHGKRGLIEFGLGRRGFSQTVV